VLEQCLKNVKKNEFSLFMQTFSLEKPSKLSNNESYAIKQAAKTAMIVENVS
jgi:hypothetical protein